MGKAPGIEKRKLTEMIEITEFIKKYMAALDQAFPDRVWFAGLQGSYGREEATEASDIDMVGILDQLSASDIHTYDAMLDTLPCRELICGFLSGRQELENWEPSELFQFCRDTTPHKRKPGPGALLCHQRRYSPGHKVRCLRRLPRLCPQYAL